VEGGIGEETRLHMGGGYRSAERVGGGGLEGGNSVFQGNVCQIKWF